MNISVAMATFNGEPHLAEQLESIRCQTRAPDELVACDDGSSDATVELLMAFRDKVQFPVRIERHTKNLGSTRAFENALSACRGDIVLLSDQDDVWRSDRIARTCRAFEENPRAVGVFSDARLTDANGSSLGRTLWQRTGVDRPVLEKLAQGGMVGFRELLKRNVITGATFAFRMDNVSAIQPFPTEWVHDYWIALHLILQGGIVGIDQPLIDYRQHGRNQLGAGRQSIMGRLRQRGDLRLSYRQMRTLNERSRALPEAARREIERKCSHLDDRIGAEKALVPVIRGWVRGDYTRYSNGMQSVLKDLIARI
ncbi:MULTISPECIES: glycosyltransferase family 2 protein [unclassified Guyparkeria]|uniref:glycosyltransferase family 2 protein n=1 Tax=unclassified Guyparkeria TaxID=2626246 RepID=UPI0018D22B69|nr:MULTISPECIES: glycosyltransferase family 2 protein [unclassified Guyparkeria]